MPPEMEVSMRRTKLKAEEAALLAGELTKPSWESRNEGIHERVSFEDTIWGFDLAGGAYYKTPLRVTLVKPDSRAEKAGIRPGDKLLRINDIDTSTLTIQEAHDIIVDSGIHLRLSVTSPEDEVDAYYCYQDPIVDDYDSEEERRLEEEKARKRRVHAKVSSFWSLQWPWVSKRRIIYRESNCFMVNSKYEEARRDKYPPLPVIRYTDDILLYQRDGDKDKVQNKKEAPSLGELKEKNRKSRQNRIANGDLDSDVTTDDEQMSHVSEDERSANREPSVPAIVEENGQEETVEDQDTEAPTVEEPIENGDVENVAENEEINEVNGQSTEEPNDLLSPIPESVEEIPVPETVEESKELETVADNLTNGISEEDMETEEVIEKQTNDDDVINEVLGKTNDNVPRSDEDNILDSILSDDGQNLESSEANNER